MQIIESKEIKLRLENGEKLHLIDVRQPEEHTDFNIGGILLPLAEIMSMQIDSIEDLKEEEVICYCRSGQRSMQSCMLLESLGFKNVKNLAGGMLGWEATYGRG
jgi:rhodanese-related sulfurtransferase